LLKNTRKQFFDAEAKLDLKNEIENYFNKNLAANL